MKLTTPFLKLPVEISADRLAAEVQALPDDAWLPHGQGFEGNEAVPLVTPDGAITNAFDGPMAPTKHLLACPYMMDVMRGLDAVWGRGRLMALAPGSDVPGHVDIHYYWRTHFRVHIPIITNPGVIFTCGDERVHMKAGECWIPDTFQRHTVHNGGSERRIHLVLDTVGGEGFWELMRAAQAGEEKPRQPDRRTSRELTYEKVNSSPIMSPYELHFHLGFLRDHLIDHPVLPELELRLDKFIAGWTAAWAQYGRDERGLGVYGDLIARAFKDVAQLCSTEVLLDNGKTFLFFFERFLLANAISKELTGRLAAASQPELRRAAAR